MATPGPLNPESLTMAQRLSGSVRPPVSLIVAPEVPPTALPSFTVSSKPDSILVFVTSTLSTLSAARDYIISESADNVIESARSQPILFVIDGLLAQNTTTASLIGRATALDNVSTRARLVSPINLADLVCDSLNRVFVALSKFGLAHTSPDLPDAPTRLSLRPGVIKVGHTSHPGNRDYGWNARPSASGVPHRAPARGSINPQHDSGRRWNSPGPNSIYAKQSRWVRHGSWESEAWPVHIVSWAYRYVALLAARPPMHSSPTNITSPPAAVAPSSSMRLLGMELDRDLEKGDWIIRVSPPAGHHRLLASAARAAHIIAEGDECPDVWYMSFSASNSPSVSSALAVAEGLKPLFDPQSLLAWGELSRYGSEWLLYSEAPVAFTPPHQRLRANFTSLGGIAVEAALERRAAPAAPLLVRGLPPSTLTSPLVGLTFEAARECPREGGTAGAAAAGAPEPRIPSTFAPPVRILHQRFPGASAVSLVTKSPAASAQPSDLSALIASASSVAAAIAEASVAPPASSNTLADSALPGAKRSRETAATPDSLSASAPTAATPAVSKSKVTFYAVVNGLKPGVYDSWPDANAQVLNVPGNEYKSFATRALASAHLQNRLDEIARANAAAAFTGSGKRSRDTGDSAAEFRNPPLILDPAAQAKQPAGSAASVTVTDPPAQLLMPVDT